MGKIAFVFSGQGDQYPGMGKDLCEQFPEAEAIFGLCDRIRPGTSSQCFDGTEDELKETCNTQPCLFAVELAASAVLVNNGITPHAVAGFSLGEITAAAFAGVFSHEDGFRLVCRRGELMQQAAEKHDTSMAAVVKLTDDAVKELCAKYTEVYPVNFNCPGQVTVSGLSEQMPDFFTAVKEAGGRAIPLKVKGAFHSPFMKEAADAFASELENTQIGAGNVALYSNVTAEPYGENAKELLAKQIVSPVMWEKIVRNMIASGIDTFIEIGPGKTLSNMIKKIDPEIKVYSTSELSQLLAEVK